MSAVIDSRSADQKGVRERLVDAAYSLMHTKGFYATTIEDILKITEVCKGSFFHYFRNKEELGYAVIETIHIRCEKMFARLVESTEGTPMGRLDAFFESRIQHYRVATSFSGCPCGMLAQELSDRHEGFRMKLISVLDAISNQIEILLRQAQNTGELHEGVDCKALARFLCSDYQGALLHLKASRDVEAFASHLSHTREYLSSLR